jgi:NitT/TauT family transport system permease protein
VFAEFKQLLLVENLTYHFLITSSEAVIGLLIGTVVGAGVGLSLWYSETAAATARPFIIALGTLPIFAFAPLMIVWFGIGFSMKVALATFSTVFVAFNQAYRGATSVSNEYVDVLRGMNASRHQIFAKVIVPGSLDWVLSSMRLNVGFGLLGAFIGEFVASSKGLGYLILRAAGLYNIPRALAAAIGITVLALLLDFLARYVEKHRHVLVQILSVPRSIWRS